MSERYNFYNIFSISPASGFIIPKFDIIVNGIKFRRGVPILPGLTFGGINLYKYTGKDIAGKWNSVTRELTFMGFFE